MVVECLVGSGRRLGASAWAAWRAWAVGRRRSVGPGRSSAGSASSARTGPSVGAPPVGEFASAVERGRSPSTRRCPDAPLRRAGAFGRLACRAGGRWSAGLRGRSAMEAVGRNPGRRAIAWLRGSAKRGAGRRCDATGCRATGLMATLVRRQVAGDCDRFRRLGAKRLGEERLGDERPAVRRPGSDDRGTVDRVKVDRRAVDRGAREQTPARGEPGPDGGLHSAAAAAGRTSWIISKPSNCGCPR